MLSTQSKKILQAILSCPTAPLHEEAVVAVIRLFCAALGLKVQSDRYGNLKVIYRRGRQSQPIAISAHLDHPGFEIDTVNGLRAKLHLLGGVNPKHFAKAKVLVVSKGRRVKGEVVKTLKLDLLRRPCFEIVTKEKVVPKSFGYFDLPSYRFHKDRIYTKAADNVVNVATLLDLLKTLVHQKINAHVVCLFTRAEEIGFVGALGAVRTGFFSKKIPLVVLEASSAKAGKIKVGGGPVLRVGDKFSTFSTEVDLWFRTVGESLMTKDASFQFQRALLPGGRCEASVYVAKGYRTGCLALPLGNYHNQGPKGYAAEYVSQKDYTALQKWLLALATTSPQQTSLRAAQSLEKNFSKYAGHLITSHK